MPSLNWSIDLGGVILAMIALVFIPVTRSLVTAIRAMLKTVQEISTVLSGTMSDPSTGLVPRVKATEHEIRRHRDRLINLEANADLKIQDRT